MKNRTRVVLTFSVLILLVSGLYLFTDWFSKVTGFFVGEKDSTELVLCLNNKGVELYYSDYCVDCKKQSDLFGVSFSSLKKINCGRAKKDCSNIRELPAWYLNKKIYYGFKTLDELENLSGCPKIEFIN